MRVQLLIFCLTVCVLSQLGYSQISPMNGGMIPKGAYENLDPWIAIGDSMQDWEGWSKNTKAGTLAVPGIARYRFEERQNWSSFYGLRLDITIPKGRVFEGKITLRTPPREVKSSYRSQASVTSATFTAVGNGREVINVPFTAFDHYYPFFETFREIQTVELDGQFHDAQPGEVRLTQVRVVQAPTTKLYSGVRSRVGEQDESIEYSLNVMNCSDREQSVVLLHHPYSKHVMTAEITPNQMMLKPGETKTCSVTVAVSDRIPPGGRERQKIVAIANGSLGDELEFITGRKLEHPYLVHTPDRWQQIREKIGKSEWAAEAAKHYTDHVPDGNRPDQRWRSAVAWQLTRDRKYADLAKPGVRADVSGKDLIQAAEIYDMIYDSGVFSPEEKKRIESAFRERMKSVSLSGVANLELQEARCGFTLALVVQDFAWFDYFLYAADGVYDNIAQGIMPDGWWYEGSVNYNIWVSRYICKMALAAEPFGINLIDHHFTPGYSKEFRRLPEDVETRKRAHGGKPFQKFGKHPKPFITLDMLWDSFVDHVAYDGTIFAANDGGELSFSSGEAFELAYMMYGKPEYASVIKHSGKRNLLYGLAELPQETPPLGTRSTYSDGIGFITLRSQTPGRHPRDQIATSLKYGTHGAYHGHFDRTNFNSLMRHDRSFYQSGHGLWYSYASFMYGFFVQSSINHNMVVVDSKNQEPVESQRLLFHSGKKMQAAVVETNARWCNPPYTGLEIRRPDRKPGEPAAYSGKERLQLEDVYLSTPDPEPESASIGEYSEPILQRRLMVVTDDYVVLADYLQGQDEHVFDNLLQIRGFQEITGGQVEATKHTDQMGTNPLLPDQLITNCQWYEKAGVSKARFLTIFDDRSSLNWRTLRGKKGNLYMDVYSAWPSQCEIMVATAPEVRGRAGWTEYQIIADGEVTKTHQFSPWLLGRDDIDIPLNDCQQLQLKTRNEDRRKGGGFINIRVDGLFWGGGTIETSDGQSITLSELEAAGKLTYDGILAKNGQGEPIQPGKDYRGGEVVMHGRLFEEAIPAQPRGNGLITIDLSDLDAVRFKVSIGADYVNGDDALKYQRKVYSARTRGKTARFLTVIEPFEKDSVVQSVTATSADELKVKLSNGTIQHLQIQQFEGDGRDIEVSLTASRNGQELYTESTRPLPPQFGANRSVERTPGRSP